MSCKKYSLLDSPISDFPSHSFFFLLELLSHLDFIKWANWLLTIYVIEMCIATSLLGLLSMNYALLRHARE